MSNFPFERLLSSVVQTRCLRSKSASSFSMTSASSSESSLRRSSSSSFTVGFLTRCCGFPSGTAIAVSRNLNLDEKRSQEYASVVRFVKSQGFSDAQVVELITRRPSILLCRPNATLKPKFDYLMDNGFAGRLLPGVILNSPIICRRGLSSGMKAAIEMLRRYIGTQEHLVLAVRRCPLVLSASPKNVERNIHFLIGQGVPLETISKMIVANPRLMLHTLDRVSNVLNAVKKLGIRPDAIKFAAAFRVRISLSDLTFERKVQNFKSFGWSEKDIRSAFKQEPSCLAFSEDKIKAIMDFFVNTLKWEPDSVIRCPRLLGCSLDKRCRPRYTILKLLESKGVIKISKVMGYMFILPEKIFLKNYVHKHLDQLPNIVELYHERHS